MKIRVTLNTMKSFMASDKPTMRGKMLMLWKVLDIIGKTSEPWNIGHSDLQIVWGHLQCQTETVSLVWQLTSIKCSRYVKITELRTVRTVTYKYYDIFHCVGLIDYTWYDVIPLNNIWNIRQNHWAVSKDQKVGMLCGCIAATAFNGICYMAKFKISDHKVIIKLKIP